MSIRRVFIVECDGGDCHTRLDVPVDIYDSEDEAAEFAGFENWITFRTETARLVYCPNCEPPSALYGSTQTEDKGGR